MISVAVYRILGHGLSNQTCGAMEIGIRRAGDEATTFPVDRHWGTEYDVALFWGFIEPCQKIMRDYRAAGKPVVYIDQGYWERGKFGHFKLAVNARHPTAYFQKRVHPDDRARALGVRAKPWASGGRNILLAGMSAKAAWAEKFEPVESFESRAIKAIRTMTDRPIIYRPKPSWKDAKPIEGVGYSGPGESLEAALADCHAVVTHHSNVAVDGLVEGVPCFVWDGVATKMGSNDLQLIETPLRPDGRNQWIADVSYTQWSLEEMRSGIAWRHLKSEGLVP